MFETNELTNYLAPNERVLWQGRSQRRFNAVSTNGLIVILVFSALIFVFVLLNVLVPVSARSRGDSTAFVVLPIILIVVGLSLGVPLLLLGNRGSNARYFVTNQSAVIVSPAAAWSGKRVTIVPLKNVQQLALTENRDGTGTLTFGQSLAAGYGRYSNSWLIDSVPTFANIERPLEVYQLIRKQMTEV